VDPLIAWDASSIFKEGGIWKRSKQGFRTLLAETMGDWPASQASLSARTGLTGISAAVADRTFSICFSTCQNMTGSVWH
jgi:hypothetical protein